MEGKKKQPKSEKATYNAIVIVKVRGNEGILLEDSGNSRKGWIWDISWSNADKTNWYVKYELLARGAARQILNFVLSNLINGVLLE